ncbi:hypothetical protein BHE74_00041876 [Ensete ventricosum]|uniref:Uncharacterized protein n=1 Tax=Ensete ventricosum TaxID=4639 RepID=A0A445MC00_ENSVE|nr:hypothetical protein BHE74_00041876 [Ensete ventricosum]RZR71744.1 hypothetical protein BHM03_00007055 [Ensete ventricosum]
MWALRDSSLAPEGRANSSRCRSVGRELGQSSHAGVDFWSLVELQLSGVCCDVLGGVAYPWSGDLPRRPPRMKLPSFAREPGDAAWT